MNAVTTAKPLTILEQAQAEVRKELAAVALTKMKGLLKEKAAAEAVVNGIDQRIADFQQAIDDGTV
jgi:hypothetical protein